MEYQRKKKSYPRNVIIFEQPVIFYDRLESFHWKDFPEFTLRKRNRKGKCSAQVTKAQSIHSTDAAPDINRPSLLSEYGQRFLWGGISVSQKAEPHFSSRYNPSKAHRNQILATILMSAMAWKRGFLSNLHVGKCI